jgi:hypothetical protein
VLIRVCGHDPGAADISTLADPGVVEVLIDMKGK